MLPMSFQHSPNLDLPSHPIWKFKHLDNQFLYLKFEQKELRVRFWPNSTGQYRDHPEGDWSDGSQLVNDLLSSQNLLHPMTHLNHEKQHRYASIVPGNRFDQLYFEDILDYAENHSNGSARVALNRAIQKIPKGIRRCLPYFACQPLDTLYLASRSRAIADLIVSTPMLFYLWSREISLCRERFLRRLQKFAQCSQVEQLSLFGFPKSKCWVKILRKVEPEGMATIPIDSFCDFARNSKGSPILKYLQHCPSIHRKAFHLIADPQLRPYIRKHLQQGYLDSRSIDHLRILQRILPVMGKADYIPKDIRIPNSLTELTYFAETIIASNKVYQTYRDWHCPSPFPTPDTWVHLNSARAIIQEGLLQRNCLSTNIEWYAPRHYLYRIKRPTRATLHIKNRHDGSLQIIECRGYDNSTIDTQHFRSIRETLNQCYQQVRRHAEAVS